MEQLEKYILGIESLNKCIQAEDDIIIYGAGDYGKRVIDYMILNNYRKKIMGIIVTDTKAAEDEYKGIRIWEADSFLSECGKGYVIIAASLPYQNDIAEIVNKFGKQYRYMTYELYCDLESRMDSRAIVPYQGIDFLLAGFFKCGTTSLYSALRQIDDIYLSEIKESHFFEWYNDVYEPEKMLIEKVFHNIREGQTVGMIEPSFVDSADRVHEFFGDRMKILFLVRNPVNALFSGFKMNNREGAAEMDILYQSSGGQYHEGMFDEYFERMVNKGSVLDWEYTYYIRQFEKYYPKEQIKIVFFEELIHNPQVIINDILKFIGVSNRYEYQKLPAENEGDFVMADLEGYKLGKIKHDWDIRNYCLSLEEVRKRRYENYCEYSKIVNQYNQAEKIYGIKMTKEQREKAEAYFNDSVRELEEMVNRDLSELWF